MSHRQVRCLFQDKKGFLWIGTENGLNRFDGYSFKVYRHDPRDSMSIGSDIVNYMYQDSDDHLWFSTLGGGVNRYVPEVDGFKRYVPIPNDPSSIAGNDGSAIVEDRNGVLWIGVGGLNRYDRRRDSFTRYVSVPDDPTTLGSNDITFLHEDRYGTFWVGTTHGLHVFDRARGTFTRYQHDPADPRSLGNSSVTSFVDDDSVMWIGTMGSGVNRLDKRTMEFSKYRHDPHDPSSLGNDNVSELVRDKNGRLWIGTWDRAGLNMFNPRRQGPPPFFTDTPGIPTMNGPSRLISARSGLTRK
ncbi:MAG: two-component regulator propeller domain-containing protein [Bacteroidota bacterium]